MNVVPSLSSLAALLLLVGRVATQAECFMVVRTGKELGIEQMQERSSLGKCEGLGGDAGETFESNNKGKQRWGRVTVDNFSVERLIVL